MNKAKLLEELHSARAEWDALLAEIGEARMTAPGALGNWSMKEIVAHLTGYSRWFVNASEALFRGEPPPREGTEGLPFDEVNRIYVEQAKSLSLAETLAESRVVSQRLIEMVEKHSEEFLIQPQQLPSAPGPFVVWHILRGNVYDHYRLHTREFRVRALYRELLDRWDARDAKGFATQFTEDGSCVGFDGSQMNGRADIETTLSRIFADHVTSAYVAKVREVRGLTPDSAVLRAVVGMVLPGASDLNPAVNAVQALVTVREAGQWRIAHFQNTPAAFHGHPELAERLTEELRQVLRGKAR
ncbi:MAG: SgcJ/EcaC family oxidoreductase [Anaerolineales bacterium]